MLSMDEMQLVSWAILVSCVVLASKWKNRNIIFLPENFFRNLWSLSTKQYSEIFEHVHLLIKAKIFILLHPSVFEISGIYSFFFKLEPLTCQNERKDKKMDSLLSLKKKTGF